MTEAEFKQLAAQGYNRIPVTLETFADLDTPLSIYLKLADRAWTYLLESVQGGERFGRYSFIGLSAPTRIVAYGRNVMVLTGNRIAERRDFSATFTAGTITAKAYALHPQSDPIVTATANRRPAAPTNFRIQSE